MNGEAQLVSIGGLEETDARRERAFAEDQPGAVARSQVEALAAADALHTLSHQSWAGLVAIWHGRHLDQDFPFGDRSSADVPSEPLRVLIPGDGSFEGWIPCDEDDTEARCVRLRWRATPQGADAEEAIEALERRSVDNLRLSREITLVANPATLLPYSTVDRLEASRTVAGRSDLDSAEEIIRTRRFTWTLQ